MQLITLRSVVPVQSIVLYCHAQYNTFGSRSECKFLSSYIKKDKRQGRLLFLCHAGAWPDRPEEKAETGLPHPARVRSMLALTRLTVDSDSAHPCLGAPFPTTGLYCQ